MHIPSCRMTGVFGFRTFAPTSYPRCERYTSQDTFGT
jgi:hypothetical protein